MADEDFSYIPPDGIRLSHDAAVEVVVALRALVDGTDELEPNRVHATTIAVKLAEALREEDDDDD